MLFGKETDIIGDNRRREVINIAIVDDENTVLEKLNGYVDRFFAQENETYRVKCFGDGVNFLSAPHGEFDIVFMDIQMPMKNGLEVAREFRKVNDAAQLIFVTNLADMAIKGYEVNALDFVVKPIEYGDFAYRMSKAVKRAKAVIRESIMITCNRQQVRISVKDLLYVEVVRHRVVYHTFDGEMEEWGTMRDTENKLKKYNFSRCNSGYLVNLRYVADVSDGMVKIGGESLQVSRSRKSGLMTDIMSYVGGSHGGGYNL